jgi:septum formation protein
MSLVLASRSPQRRAILFQLGLDFRVVEPTYLEEHLPVPAHVLAERHSLGKARSVEARAGETVIGVDTIVLVDGRVLGKPADAHEAARMLAMLAGRTHHVVSGLTLRDALGEQTGHALTSVHFRALDGADVEEYVARGEWRGRAGAYAIQEAGAALVTGVDGCFYNVVGLPVALLVEMLAERRRFVSG